MTIRIAVRAAVLLVLWPAVCSSQVQDSTTKYAYDAQGNLTTITDPNGQVTTQAFDALNRRTQITQPIPQTGGTAPVITIGYDGLDHVVSVKDPRSLATNYHVDGLGNLLTLASPDTGTTVKTFDVAGNVLASTDARGKVTRFTYDALNRVMSISFVTGTATSFTYDGGTAPQANDIGRLTGMADESGSTRYFYDAFGHVVQKSQVSGSGASALTQVVQYQYGTTGSVNGRLVGLVYPTGMSVGYTYDTAGRVASLTLTPPAGSPTALLGNISYQPFGQPSGWTWGNGTAYSRTFDLDGRLTSFPLGALSGAAPTPNALLRSLAYDPASRISSYWHADASGSQTNPVAIAANQSFTYDNLDRLAGYYPAGSTQLYAYDNSGNRTGLAIGSAGFSYVVDPASNKLTQATGPILKNNLYDAAGNLTSDGTVSYGYSDRGRKTSATVGANSFGYLYNGIGQRIVKSGPASILATGSQRYVYDEAGHLLGEYDGLGNPVEESIFLADTPVVVLKAQ